MRDLGPLAVKVMGIFFLSLALNASASSAPKIAPIGVAGAFPENSNEENSEVKWWALLRRKPYPYRPLPEPVPTVLDGTYAKVDPQKAPPIPCRRCPDYAPEGGVWRLNLGRGVFRIFHVRTGWRSIGSFVVNGQRLILFNDPCCHEVIGTYIWSMEKGQLVLKVAEDPCAIRLRAENLSRQPWFSCRPLSMEPGASGHWQEPVGCR